MPDLVYLDEPKLLFRFEQSMIDPRDGLSLFGPLERAKPHGIRWAVIGPKGSIRHVKNWIQRISGPIISGTNFVARPIFPGFEAAFSTKFSADPALECEISENDLYNHAHNADRHQRVFRSVDLYSSRLERAHLSEDVSPDLWFVVIPEYVYTNCRPLSTVNSSFKTEPDNRMTRREARDLQKQPSLFADVNSLAEEYLYDVNFHNQLKARLLKHQIPTQILREAKIAFREFTNSRGLPQFPLENQESALAWNISTAAFYKAGGKPWKLGAAREGVCYIGLVFKQDETSKNPRTACCAAQMFLDSGDGVVFKGAVGPWYRGKRGLYHLDYDSARELVDMCIEVYAQKHNSHRPKELFIHGRVELNDEEYRGFVDAAGSITKVVGVRIKPDSSLKLFRLGSHPVLRGTAFIINEKKSYLWTRGMVPRLRTYPGREVPNPIMIDICKGDANIKTVMRDILALTKLNYNSCTFSDGLPVTIKFANAVGEILTAGPSKKLKTPPLPFKYYI